MGDPRGCLKCFHEQFFKILHGIIISKDACCRDFPFPKLWGNTCPTPKADYVPVPLFRAKDSVVNKTGTIPVLKESTIYQVKVCLHGMNLLISVNNAVTQRKILSNFLETVNVFGDIYKNLRFIHIPHIC